MNIPFNGNLATRALNDATSGGTVNDNDYDQYSYSSCLAAFICKHAGFDVSYVDSRYGEWLTPRGYYRTSDAARYALTGVTRSDTIEYTDKELDHWLAWDLFDRHYSPEDIREAIAKRVATSPVLDDEYEVHPQGWTPDKN